MRNRFLGFGCGIGSGAESDPLKILTDVIGSSIIGSLQALTMSKLQAIICLSKEFELAS